MHNFMYNVMTHGIGGINCGGIEHDVVPGRGQEMAVRDTRAYQYLTRTPDHAKMYVDMGYLTPRRALGRLSGYVLTPEGREKFSGSKAVEDWMSEAIATRAAAKATKELLCLKK